MFDMLRQLLLALFCARSPQRGRRPQRANLVVEALEDRLAPATYVWTGAVGGDNLVWSNLQNWAVDSKIPETLPGELDSLVFDGTGFAGEIRNSVVDTVFTVGNLTVKDTYTKTIFLDWNLRVRSQTTIEGGTIDGVEDLFIGPTVAPLALPTFTWKGGTLRTSAENVRVWIDGSATASISGNADKTLTGRTIYLSAGATLTWTGAGKIVSNSNGNAIGGIEIAGIANFQTTAALEGNATTQVDAGGVLNTSLATGEVTIKTPFINNGAVNVNQGNVQHYKSSRNSGTITVASGSLLAFAAGQGVTHFLDSTQGSNQSIITGTGSAAFAGGSRIRVTGTANVANVADGSDLVDGTGNLQINGEYVWGGKKWAGTGQVQVGTTTTPSPKLFIGAAGALELERKLINYGTVNWTNSNITVANGGAIDNRAGALFDVQVDRSIIKGAGAGNLTNAGTLKKTLGNGEAIIELDVDPLPGGQQLKPEKGKLTFKKKVSMLGGEVEVSPGAILAFDDGFDKSGGSLILVGETGGTGGTLRVTDQFLHSGGTASYYESSVLEVPDGLLHSGGTTLFDAQVSVVGPVTVAGGEAKLYGTLTLTHTLVTSSTGVFSTIFGTVYGNIQNGGIVEVGGNDAIGILTIVGDYTQTSSGDLRMEIAGTDSYDRLEISGQAKFGSGDLYVELLNGSVPSAGDPSGDTFDLITWGSWDGSVFLLHLPSFPGGHFEAHYDDPLGSKALSLWAVE